uniref:NADH-ubiquinone oxidoreductase chain 3 n=1 Tax=Baicaloclepsis echinulata TaxID=2995197 RepID=A0A9E8GEA9_9ANNE|nr:NADH dehydrogenase subunit 3 [Baicaloclepsis echinulata]UZT67822.1 NADH dehydrogenase subunit 3 [Baicaloclepsis echinulata]
MLIMTMCFMLSLFIPALVYYLSVMLYMRVEKNRNKMTPFECGFDPNMQARIPFSTRFFLLAVIFIVFDIEIVLLMPLPIIISHEILMPHLKIFCLILMILLIGLIHELYEGALDWLK